MRPIFLFLLLAHSSIGAWAKGGGGSGGNGGQGIVCGADAPEAFDLFEGRSFFGYAYPRSAEASGGFARALAIAARLDSISGAREAAFFTERVKYVAQQVERVTDQPRLALTTDIGETYVPAGCHLIQMIITHDDFTIEANRTWFNRLPEESKAALYLHEAVYWYLRDTKEEPNSRRTRRIVSFLLAGGSLADAPAAFTAYDPTPAYCTLPPGQGEVAGFYLFADPAGSLVALSPVTAKQPAFALSRYRGRLAGGSLVAAGEFSPSASADVSGSLPRWNGAGLLAVALHLDRDEAWLKIQSAAEENSEPLPLSCLAYPIPLPGSGGP